MARGKQHRMAGLDPQTANSAADMAGADDADAPLCLSRCKLRSHRGAKDERDAADNEPPATRINKLPIER
jgi:hypothetical protein